VAAVTARIHPVIPRIVTIAIMAEDIRCPAVCRVTRIALYIRADMILRLRSRTSARTVTFIASTGCAGIVEPAAADEGRGGMTEVTIQ